MSLTNPFKKKLQMTGYVYEAKKHTGWGDAINWSSFEKRRIYGHLQRKPEIGDEIVFDMKTGKQARFAVINVTHESDPPDMFFADVMDIGYIDESPLNKVKEAAERKVEPRAEGIRFLI